MQEETALQAIDKTMKIIVPLLITAIFGLVWFDMWSYQNTKKPYYDCVNLKTQKRFNLLDEGQYQRIILQNLNIEHACSKHMYTREYVDFLNKKR